MSASDHRTRTRPSTGARALGAAAMASYLLPSLSFYSSKLRDALGVEDRAGDGAGCALTFDDGPHVQGTPATLEALASAGARATFFLVGEQVRRNPAIVGEIVAAGHDIGLHCDRHRNLLRLTPRQVQTDLARAKATIEQETGRAIGLYRPPYGILNATALRQARDHGWRTLLWSHWGKDWQAKATPESIAALATHDVRAGAVLLLHDADDYSAPGSWRRTVAALPLVLEALAERGLQPSSL
jgi:peptidoglycan-N-acetylglucosamine deacetylase